jgi:hypothetical protein
MNVDFTRFTPSFSGLFSPVHKGTLGRDVEQARMRADTKGSSVFIFGRRGRIGGELERLAALNGLAVSEDPGASVHLVAKSWEDSTNYLEALRPEVTAIDLSGALKSQGLGRYGLIVGGRLLSEGASRVGERFANPGCMASAVILALAAAGLDRAESLDGPIHVAVTGGASMASRASEGSWRAGHKWLSHPHVGEIKRAMPGIAIASFVPAIAYGQERGLLAVLSGRVSEVGRARLEATGGDSPEVASVLKSARLDMRLDLTGSDFSLAVAADNITLPSANAVALASAILMGGFRR